MQLAVASVVLANLPAVTGSVLSSPDGLNAVNSLRTWSVEKAKAGFSVVRRYFTPITQSSSAKDKLAIQAVQNSDARSFDQCRSSIQNYGTNNFNWTDCEHLVADNLHRLSNSTTVVNPTFVSETHCFSPYDAVGTQVNFTASLLLGKTALPEGQPKLQFTTWLNLASLGLSSQYLSFHGNVGTATQNESLKAVIFSPSLARLPLDPADGFDLQAKMQMTKTSENQMQLLYQVGRNTQFLSSSAEIDLSNLDCFCLTPRFNLGFLNVPHEHGLPIGFQASVHTQTAYTADVENPSLCYRETLAPVSTEKPNSVTNETSGNPETKSKKKSDNKWFTIILTSSGALGLVAAVAYRLRQIRQYAQNHPAPISVPPNTMPTEQMARFGAKPQNGKVVENNSAEMELPALV